MIAILSLADDILRRRRWTAQSAQAGLTVWRLGACMLLFGMLYGGVIGGFDGVRGDRLWQVLYSSLKVPLLLMATFLIGLPSFFVLNTLFGLRRDFVESLHALVAAQAGLAIVLASLAPLTAVWYASSADYPAAIRFNALMFAVASFAGQGLLHAYYRPLLRRSRKHRWMLWTWLATYVFVGIQMGWILRPFVGAPGVPVQFFRAEGWGNAYVVVARLIYDALVR
jgi:hypothetical protein